MMKIIDNEYTYSPNLPASSNSNAPNHGRRQSDSWADLQTPVLRPALKNRPHKGALGLGQGASVSISS